MQIVPLNPVPSQTTTVLLAQQPCRINIYTKTTGMFCDLYLNDTLIIGGVVCEDLNRIVRDAYLGFAGDLAFYDTQGASDPAYAGLGDRYVLLYLSADEAAAL